MNIRELAARYNTSPQGVRQFVKRNISEINYDGDHVRLRGKRWYFDDVAVSRIDELRGFKVASESPTVIVERECDVKIDEQITILKNLIILQQSEWTRKQNEMETLLKRLMETQEKLLETQRQLSETQQKLLTTQQQQNDPPKKHGAFYKLKRFFLGGD